MLSPETIMKINDQIRDEIRELDRGFKSDAEKAAVLDRITKLTAVLNPQPSREELLSELAAAIVETKKPYVPSQSTFADAIFDFAARYRR